MKGIDLMSNLPNCPKCESKYTYEDMHILVCPECGHEWSLFEEDSVSEEKEAKVFVVRDAYGSELVDGDDVTIIKDLKVRGSSNPLKIGTKVKNIKLIQNGDHNFDCRIDGFGRMELKSEFVKKA